MGCPEVCPNYGTCTNNECTCLKNYGGDQCIWRQCNATANALKLSPDECPCAHGFKGVNCNVCTQDSDCKFFKGGDLNSENEENDPLICNPTSFVGRRHHMSCGLEKSVFDDNFGGEKRITITRLRDDQSMIASLWINNEEQFMCHGWECENTIVKNTDTWECKKINCKCKFNTTMCLEAGFSVKPFFKNLTELFLLECPFASTYPVSKEIQLLESRKATLETPFYQRCLFKMGNPIGSILSGGLGLINCEFGECGRVSSFPEPNFISPAFTVFNILVLSSVSFFFFTLLVLFILGYYQRRLYRRRPVPPLPQPKEYTFSNVSYTLNEKPILSDLQGSFAPSTLTCILGPSGAGKSSLLDILAHKRKKGHVQAQFSMDKQPLFFGDKSFQHLMGFVDQEDVLLPWLTVLESLWFVADTRLPESLKLDEKKRIIEEVMETLNISHIQHSKIGGAKAFRGISGGERRRVSVAMELITSPAILFLDEPTTGLDSHNAYKLMKCLADLSHQHHKTIVCTIHQPRHDVYALCDQIMLMSQGIILYQGPSHSAKSFLQSIGFPCPEHRHVSDHMIDLAMQPKLLQTLASTSPTHNSTSFDSFLTSYSDHSTNSSPESSRWKAKLNFLFHAFKLPKLSLPSFLKRKKQENLDSNTTSLLNSSSYMVSYVTQLNCLLLRSLKCLLRNKRLFLGHNMVAICLGCFMSLCYMYTTLTLEGFVNLVGIIVFLHLIITFSSFSTLHHMASDRLLFIRERGNHCYRPSTYFLSKLLMDLIPLRLLPTLWISSIVYFTCGFQVTYVLYFKFILVFLLYTSGVTLVCMIISVYFSDSTLANFTNSVTMLLFVLFSGIWVNLTQLTSALSWLQYLSLARWSSDALATSQLQMLKFETAWKDRKMMLEGTMFLKISFGFEIDSFVTKVSVLMGIDILLLFILGFSIVYKLKEIR